MSLSSQINRLLAHPAIAMYQRACLYVFLTCLIAAVLVFCWLFTFIYFDARPLTSPRVIVSVFVVGLVIGAVVTYFAGKIYRMVRARLRSSSQ